MKTRRHAIAASFLWMSLLDPGAVFAQDSLRVDLVSLVGFSSADHEKARRSADIMERVMNSADFRQAVLDFTYDGKKQFANNNGLTNEEIYDKIMEAKEIYSSYANQAVDLDLVLYTPPWYRRWSVIGYGYPGQPEIFLNWYYFNSFTTREIASNLTHEWLHKLGFEHDYERTARRHYSVPYGVGDLIDRLSRSLPD